MQLSLPFLDIIIFAIIAIFLVYRLKSILGQNSDGNEQNNKIDVGEKNFNNVVKLGKKQSDRNGTKFQGDTIYKDDPTFNEKDFYFVHSYIFENISALNVLAVTKYGKNFPSTFLPDSVNAIESNKFSGI